MNELAPVCILAGGRATRLGDVVAETPKPLLPVAGRPFIFHQLDLLRRSGAREVVICTGYLGTQFQDTVGDGAASTSTSVTATTGQRPSAPRAPYAAPSSLLGERFLVLYGDTYLRIDYAAVDRTARERGLPALMTVLRNEGRWDTSNATFDGDRVVRYDKASPDPGMHFIDYGLSVMTAEALRTEPTASDLSTIFHALAQAGDLAGFEATERFYEIGTPAALREADAFLAGS